MSGAIKKKKKKKLSYYLEVGGVFYRTEWFSSFVNVLDPPGCVELTEEDSDFQHFTMRLSIFVNMISPA